MAALLIRWTIAAAIALSATATYALALLYFTPPAAIGIGRVAVFVCLVAMFAGVVFVRGKVIFGQLVPLAASGALALTLLFAGLVVAFGLADVPTPAFFGLALLPLVLFGAPIFVRMLIRVW